MLVSVSSGSREDGSVNGTVSECLADQTPDKLIVVGLSVSNSSHTH